MAWNLQRSAQDAENLQRVIQDQTRKTIQQQAIRRIRTYSGQELKGRELFDALGVRYLG